jgi:SAM-dependent methyltransferase
VERKIGNFLSTIQKACEKGILLDIACGPGGWALEMALAYPSIQVTGIDISPGMIDYANAQAHASGLDNVKFQVATITDPLTFPDDTFDLIKWKPGRSAPGPSACRFDLLHQRSRFLCESKGFKPVHAYFSIFMLEYQ